MNKILVVVAHPDDEVLGVGATVARYVEKGDIVQCLILGEGQTSRFNNRDTVDKDIIDKLHADTLEAAKYVGYSKVDFANLPDNRFDQVELIDVVKLVEAKINEFRPNIIYTHHFGDLNIDHQYTYHAVITATRPMKDCCVKEIYTFETLSSSEWNFGLKQSFEPNVFIDISKYIEHKKKAMQCYKTELCQYPHPRSEDGIELLAKYRGLIVGKSYVEAFQCIRKIID
ncbi:PIG-L deacetylase family protein [Anaerosporobacter faecicola]|uniref:PIG-L deacetylase family protein n=1 Tax=Anaerosporobacter faecicola TaxID=2718714 RepID=UPI00143B3913|nr:PIG-L deacetylase family protein [Anaerosporobacter faecicola]